MAKSNLRLVTPATVNRTVAPKRPKNADLRTREHLSPAEVEKLIEAAGPIGTVLATLSWPFSPSGMAYERPRWSTFVGNRSTLKARPCTSAESRTAPRQRIR